MHGSKPRTLRSSRSTTCGRTKSTASIFSSPSASGTASSGTARSRIIFLPVVKKMFPQRTKENHAEYSGVMAYAWEENTPSNDLPAFIGSNVQKTYRKYLAIKKARQAAAKSAAATAVTAAPFLDHVYNALRLMLLLTYRGQASTTGKLKNTRSFILRNHTNEAGEFEGIIETAFPSDTITAPAARMILEGPIEQLQGIAYVLTDMGAQQFVDMYPTRRDGS